jgi:hypothetical protein
MNPSNNSLLKILRFGGGFLVELFTFPICDILRRKRSAGKKESEILSHLE